MAIQVCPQEDRHAFRAPYAPVGRLPHDWGRALAATVRIRIGYHSFPATDITEYLRNGGKLEIAQQMTNNESSRTTRRYDRR